MIGMAVSVIEVEGIGEGAEGEDGGEGQDPCTGEDQVHRSSSKTNQSVALLCTSSFTVNWSREMIHGKMGSGRSSADGKMVLFRTLRIKTDRNSDIQSRGPTPKTSIESLGCATDRDTG